MRSSPSTTVLKKQALRKDNRARQPIVSSTDSSSISTTKPKQVTKRSATKRPASKLSGHETATPLLPIAKKQRKEPPPITPAAPTAQSKRRPELAASPLRVQNTAARSLERSTAHEKTIKKQAPSALTRTKTPKTPRSVLQSDMKASQRLLGHSSSKKLTTPLLQNLNHSHDPSWNTLRTQSFQTRSHVEASPHPRITGRDAEALSTSLSMRAQSLNALGTQSLPPRNHVEALAPTRKAGRAPESLSTRGSMRAPTVQFTGGHALPAPTHVADYAPLRTACLDQTVSSTRRSITDPAVQLTQTGEDACKDADRHNSVNGSFRTTFINGGIYHSPVDCQFHLPYSSMAHEFAVCQNSTYASSGSALFSQAPPPPITRVQQDGIPCSRLFIQAMNEEHGRRSNVENLAMDTPSCFCNTPPAKVNPSHDACDSAKQHGCLTPLAAMIHPCSSPAVFEPLLGYSSSSSGQLLPSPTAATTPTTNDTSNLTWLKEGNIRFLKTL